MVLGYIQEISHLLTDLICLFIIALWYNSRERQQSTLENIKYSKFGVCIFVVMLGYIRGSSHLDLLPIFTCVYVYGSLWYTSRKRQQSTPENINSEPEKLKQNFQRCVLLVPNNGGVTQIDAFFKNKQVVYAILPPATEQGKYKTLYIKDLEVSDEFVITKSSLESRTEPCCFERICAFDSKDEAIEHIAEKISVYDQPKENQSIEDSNLFLHEEEFPSIDDLAIGDIVIRKAQTNDAIQILRLLNYNRTGKLLEFQVLPKIPDTECNIKWFETGIPSDIFPYCFVKIDPNARKILKGTIMKIEEYDRPVYLLRQKAESNDYDKQVGKYIHEYSRRMVTEFWTFVNHFTKEELVLFIRECWDLCLKQRKFLDFISISNENREELPIFFETISASIESGLKKLDQMSDEDFEIVEQVIAEVGKLHQSDEIKCKENTDLSFIAFKAFEVEVEELNRKYGFNFKVHFLIAVVLAILPVISLNNTVLDIIREFLWATICVAFLINFIRVFFHYANFVKLVKQPSIKNILKLMTSEYVDAILDNFKRNIEKCDRDPVKITGVFWSYMSPIWLTPLESLCYMNLLKRQERFGMFSKQFSNKSMVEFEEDIHRRFIEYIAKMLSIEDALEVCTKKQLALAHFSKNLLTHLQKYPFILNENGTCRELSQEDKDGIEPHLKSIDKFLYKSAEFLLHMQAMKTDILNIVKSDTSTPFYTLIRIIDFPVDDPDDKNFLGRGSFGHVRKIEFGFFNKQQHLNKHVAVKRLKLNAKRREKYIIDAYKMFYERSILDKLKHENIVDVSHAWIQYPYSKSLQPITNDGFEMYVIMEFCDSSLKKYVQERGAIDENENLVIITDILKGLKFLHENQYIHRDIKPDNILIKKTKGRNKYILGDFGSSRRIPIKRLFSENVMKYDSYKTKDADEVDLFTLSTGSLGTHPYAAPEFKIKEQFYNDKVDIFSLGKIIKLDLYKEEESLLPSKILEDFVKLMIHEDPESRPSSEECLQFFSQFLPVTSRNALTQDDLENAPENKEESDGHENKLEILLKRIEERNGLFDDDFLLLDLIDLRFFPILPEKNMMLKPSVK